MRGAPHPHILQNEREERERGQGPLLGEYERGGAILIHQQVRERGGAESSRRARELHL